MATFAELLADVIVLTNRPDLVNETKLAVKAATLKMHQIDFFYKDIYETGISFSSSEYSQQLEYRTLLPRFRSLKYLRESDSLGTVGKFFTVLTPAETLDTYGYTKRDVVYAAGELLQINSSSAFQYAILGCYLNPDVTEAGFNSWVALDHPYAIVYEAALTVFKMIGFDEQAVVVGKLALEQIAMVRSSNIQVEGY
jgi:hypothetical protein